MKTIFVNESAQPRTWYVIDAAGKPLGRVAAKAASVLRGKNKPSFATNQNMGDYVVIINAAKHFRISIPKSRCLVILQLSICMQDSFITLYLFIFYFAQVPKAIYLTGL